MFRSEKYATQMFNAWDFTQSGAEDVQDQKLRVAELCKSFMHEDKMHSLLGETHTHPILR